MRSCIVVLALLGLFGSTRAGAAGNAVALIWKGSPDKATAESQKSSWGTLEKRLTLTAFSVPEGYPKLVESKTVPGLKPGFWVWLLGLCTPEDAADRLEHVKRLAPGTYSREVTVPEAQVACPTLGDEALKARDEVLKLPSGATVRVFTQEESESPDEEGNGRDLQQTRYHFVLFSKAGELLDAVDTLGDESVTSDRGPEGPVSYRCELTRFELSKKKGPFVLTRHCSSGAAECGSVVSADERVTVSVNGETLSLDESRTNEDRAECD